MHFFASFRGGKRGGEGVALGSSVSSRPWGWLHRCIVRSLSAFVDCFSRDSFTGRLSLTLPYSSLFRHFGIRFSRGSLTRKLFLFVEKGSISLDLSHSLLRIYGPSCINYIYSSAPVIFKARVRGTVKKQGGIVWTVDTTICFKSLGWHSMFITLYNFFSLNSLKKQAQKWKRERFCS